MFSLRLTPLKLGFVTHQLKQVRFRAGKHWKPEFRRLRALKVVHVNVPDFFDKSQDLEHMDEETRKFKLKRLNVFPERPWKERSMYVSATGGIFEPYVPPEGDGKVSPITALGAKQKIEFIEKKSKSMMAVRKIRKFEENFEFFAFLEEAQNVYVKLHETMCSQKVDDLTLYVTERAYLEVVDNIADKTLRWKFVESIERPRVCHVRCTNIVTKENIFAQITVRFHTRQLLSIYDRFGRLLHGSETIPKDVLEYIVFEKHISNVYGAWRVHDKIIPDWAPPKEPLNKTFVVAIDDNDLQTSSVTNVDEQDRGISRVSDVSG